MRPLPLYPLLACIFALSYPALANSTEQPQNPSPPRTNDSPSLPPPIPALTPSSTELKPIPPVASIDECALPSLPKKTAITWVASRATLDLSGPARCIALIADIPEHITASRQGTSITFSWTAQDPPAHTALTLIDTHRNQSRILLSPTAPSTPPQTTPKKPKRSSH